MRKKRHRGFMIIFTYLIREVLPQLIIIGDQFTRPDRSKVQDRQARCPWILLTLPGGRVANLNQVLAT